MGHTFGRNAENKEKVITAREKRVLGRGPYFAPGPRKGAGKGTTTIVKTVERGNVAFRGKDETKVMLKPRKKATKKLARGLLMVKNVEIRSREKKGGTWCRKRADFGGLK